MKNKIKIGTRFWFESKVENFYYVKVFLVRLFFDCSANRLTVCWGRFGLIVTSWLMPSLVATRRCGTLVISYTSGFITTAVKFRLRVASLRNKKKCIKSKLKVSKSRKRVMVSSILPKNERKKWTLLLQYLRSNCFRSFFGRIEETINCFWDWPLAGQPFNSVENNL